MKNNKNNWDLKTSCYINKSLNLKAIVITNHNDIQMNKNSNFKLYV